MRLPGMNNYGQLCDYMTSGALVFHFSFSNPEVRFMHKKYESNQILLLWVEGLACQNM